MRGRRRVTEHSRHGHRRQAPRPLAPPARRPYHPLMATVTRSARAAVFNLPNGLTLARLVLAVGLFACIDAAWWLTGLVVFALAAVTDWLDGYLARRHGSASAFGRN